VWVTFVIAGLAAGLALFVSWSSLGHSPWSDGPATAAHASPGVSKSAEAAAEGRLKATNSSGRQGAFFIPRHTGPIPVMVFFHATGGNGAQVVAEFRRDAVERSFAIVAPDSRVVQGYVSWEVGDKPGEVTDDLIHARRCLEEVLAMPGFQLRRTDMLAAGFSGGASSAPYLATNDNRFAAFAVLHGGVFEKGFGSNRVRGFLATGDRDELRPPNHVAEQARNARSAGVASVVLRTFSGCHSVSGAERAAMLTWWLDSLR
jgi:predicted esterase